MVNILFDDDQGRDIKEKSENLEKVINEFQNESKSLSQPVQSLKDYFNRKCFIDAKQELK